MGDALGTGARVGLGEAPRVDAYCLVLLLGFGMFRALMSLAYSVGLAPSETLHPLANDVPYAMTSSGAMVLCCLLLCTLSWRRASLSLRLPAVAGMLALGAVCLLAGFGGASAISGALALVVSAVAGAATVVANVAWLSGFAGLAPRRCLATLVSAMLLGSVLSACLCVLPAPGRAICLAALSVTSAALFWCHASMEPLGTVTPAPGDALWLAGARRASVRGACAEIWSPLVIFACLNMVAGFVTAFQASGSPMPGGGAIVGRLAHVVANVGMALLVFWGNDMFDVRALFRRCFPAIALLLALLPFMDHAYGIAFNAALTVLNVVVSTCTLFLVMESARVWRIPATLAFSGVLLVSQALQLLALLAGWALGAQEHLDQTTRFLVVVVVSLYLLAMALAAPSRAQRRGRAEVSMDDVDAFVGVASAPAPGVAPGEPASARGAGAPAPDASAPSLDERVHAVAADFLLTRREEEVLRLLARGRTSVWVAGELGLATNTVRGYVQGIYAKLGVHSRQELIDLVER